MMSYRNVFKQVPAEGSSLDLGPNSDTSYIEYILNIIKFDQYFSKNEQFSSKQLYNLLTGSQSLLKVKVFSEEGSCVRSRRDRMWQRGRNKCCYRSLRIRYKPVLEWLNPETDKTINSSIQILGQKESKTALVGHQPTSISLCSIMPSTITQGWPTSWEWFWLTDAERGLSYMYTCVYLFLYLCLTPPPSLLDN